MDSHKIIFVQMRKGENKMPPKENEVELSELYALEEQVEDLKDALYDARKQLKNAIIIPKGATNGDMIKAMFNIPDSEIDEGLSTTYLYTNTRVLKGGSQDYLREQITFNRDWWNAPYKKGREE